MAEKFQLRGVVGQIQYCYYTAAALHGYTVTRVKKTGVWSLHGTVVQSDAFKLRQRPLTFIAPHAKGQWRWAIDSHQIDPQGTITAILSPLKE